MQALITFSYKQTKHKICDLYAIFKSILNSNAEKVSLVQEKPVFEYHQNIPIS